MHALSIKTDFWTAESNFLLPRWSIIIWIFSPLLGRAASCSLALSAPSQSRIPPKRSLRRRQAPMPPFPWCKEVSQTSGGGANISHPTQKVTMGALPAGSAHTGTASPHCAHACGAPGGISGWSACHTHHTQMASHLQKGENRCFWGRKKLWRLSHCSHTF